MEGQKTSKWQKGRKEKRIIENLEKAYFFLNQDIRIQLLAEKEKKWRKRKRRPVVRLSSFDALRGSIMSYESVLSIESIYHGLIDDLRVNLQSQSVLLHISRWPNRKRTCFLLNWSEWEKRNQLYDLKTT